MTTHAESHPIALSTPAAPGLRAWFMIAILMTMSAVAYLDRHVLTLMVEPIRADLGVTDFQLSLLQGFGFACFYATFALPLGWLADRGPRRWIIFIGVSIWSLATASGSLARNFVELLLARLGVGAGEAALMPAGYSMVSDTFPRRHLTAAVSAFSAGSAIGAAAALMLGGYLVSYAQDRGQFVVPLLGSLQSWQFVFLVTGLPGVAIAFLIFLVKEPVRRGVSVTGRPPLLPFLRSRSRMFIGHFGGFSLKMMLTTAVMAWTPSYLIRRFDWDVAQIGTVLAIQAVCSIGTVMAIGWFVDRWFHRGRTDAHFRFFLFITPMTVVLLGIAFMMDDAVSFLFFSIIASCLMPTGGVASGAIQIVTPNELRGQVSALYLFISNMTALTLGPMSAALFTDYVFRDDNMVGWSMFAVSALVAPLAMLFLWLGCRGMREAVAKFGEETKHAVDG